MTIFCTKLRVVSGSGKFNSNLEAYGTDPPCRLFYVFTSKFFINDRHNNPKKKDKDRIEGKGRRYCLGAESINFFATLTILHQDNLKNRTNWTRTI